MKKNTVSSNTEQEDFKLNSENELAKTLGSILERLTEIETTKAVSVQPNITSEKIYYPAPKEEKGCCCFEIILYRARVLVAQGGAGSIEPSDGGGPLNSNMELIFGATADGFSAAYPGVASYVSMSENGGWLVFNQKIALVEGNQSIAVSASAREIEATILESKAGKGEFGNSETAYMNLTCDCQVMPVQLEVQLSGGSINKRGLVLVELTAKKVCCPCC